MKRQQQTLVKIILAVLGLLSLVSVPSVSAGTVYLDNFPWSGDFDPYDQPDSDYFFWSTTTPEYFVADDGEILQRRNSTHTLDITPFESTVGQGVGGALDHRKNCILHKTFWHTASDKILKCELDVKTELLHTDLHPFGNLTDDHENDLRLAHCALKMYDPNTFIELKLAQTNLENQPMYSRLPEGKGLLALGDYRAFVSSKTGVSMRPHASTYQRLAIEYHRNDSLVQWFVDGMLIHSISMVGVPSMSMDLLIDHGGMDTIVDPQGFYCGFECGTLLDGSNPLNATQSEGLVRLVHGIQNYYVHPTSFNDTHSDLYSRTWGQGVISSRRKFKVGLHDH